MCRCCCRHCMMVLGRWRQRDAASMDVVVTGGGGGEREVPVCITVFDYITRT